MAVKINHLSIYCAIAAIAFGITVYFLIMSLPQPRLVKSFWNKVLPS